MPVANEPLVLDLIEWVAQAPRAYAEVMAAWRTSCPRLPVWEDALDHGFVTLVRSSDRGLLVEVTEVGRAFLGERRLTA